MKKSLSFILTCLLYCSTAFAEIHQTADLAVIRDEILRCEKNTLVIFDVDQVLITPTDRVFPPNNTQERAFLDNIVNGWIQHYPKNEVENIFSIVMLAEQTRLVTPDTAEIFKQIQREGYKIIGLTAAGTGHSGKIISLESWRVERLRNLGISFNKSFPETHAKQLDKYLSGVARGNTSITCSAEFKDGILFTCHFPKGETLDAYLRMAKIKPKKIIFIDDQLRNITTVNNYCTSVGIEFVGFEYTAVKEQLRDKPYDYKRARLQLAVLEQGKVWLDDKQAERILADLNQVTVTSSIVHD